MANENYGGFCLWQDPRPGPLEPFTGSSALIGITALMTVAIFCLARRVVV